MTEQKLYSLNEKGTNLSYGIVTEEIVAVLKQTGIANHLDIKEVHGGLGSSSGTYNGASIRYISVRTNEESLTGETGIFRNSSKDLTKEELIELFKKD